MALTKLTIKPGLNRDQTNYTNEGGWWACNKIRFLSGFPQKLGGWLRYSLEAYIGYCRSLLTWSAPGSYNFMALGTNEKIYVESGGQLHNITPLRISTPAPPPFSTPDTDNCFATTSGDSIVTATFTAVHNANIGDWVVFSGASTVAGLDLNGEFKILSIPSSYSFTFDAGATASSTVAAGGGTAIIANFEIPVGYGTTTAGYGWGVVAWGSGPWGYPAATPANAILRLVYFDNDVSDLYFNIRYGVDYDGGYTSIYYWPADPAFTTRAVALKDTLGASDVPEQVTQILFDDSSGVLLAFGCTPFGGGTFDPMLIRWSSIDNPTTGVPGPRNWTVDADPGISVAGYLRLQSGSQIMQAVPNAENIYVFTESSLTRIHNIGADYATTNQLFSADLISADVTLIAPKAAIAVNSVLYWMGKDKFFMFTGQVETLPCTIRQYVFEDINFAQSDQFYAASNERYHEIWWWYCSSDSNSINRYVVYNYVEQIWYYGNTDDGMSRTAWSDSPLRQYPQAANGDGGYIFNHECGYDADDQPMTSYITSSDMDLPPDGDKFMLIRRIIPDVSFAGSTTVQGVSPTVDLTLTPRNFPGSAYMTSNQEGQTYARAVASSTTVPVEEFTEQVFVRARARQMGFTISSSGIKGVNWQLGSPRLDMREDGMRG